MALQAMNTGSNPVGVAYGIFTGSGAEIVCRTSPGRLHDRGAQPQ